MYRPAKVQTVQFHTCTTIFNAMDWVKAKLNFMLTICSAQNKNAAFLWRVMNGLHHTINYDFLLPGQTKFPPDWCFGLVKQKTWRIFISSLFARAVQESASVNVAELAGLHNETVCIQTYDCVTFPEDIPDQDL